MHRTRLSLTIGCLLLAACTGTAPASFVTPPTAAPAAPTAPASSATSGSSAAPVGSVAPTVVARPADGQTPAVFVLLKGADGTSSIGAFSPATGRILAQTPAGVPAPDWSTIYAATTAGTRTTVTAFHPRSGLEIGSAGLDGTWKLPAAVPGALPDGLARSAGTLVLEDTAPPTGMSRYALVDTAFTAPPQILQLKGAFAFDAIGPNGHYVFFIERLGEAGSGHYQVRAYDTWAGRLLEGAIVDKREIGESMEGAPVARATSADGQWAYTLYVKADGTAFVHQLDTLNAFALCADLPDDIHATTAADRAAWRIGLAGNGLPFVANGRLGLVGRVDMGEVSRVDRLPAALTGVDLGFAVGSGGLQAYLAGPTGVSVIDTATLKLLGAVSAAASGGAVVSDHGASLFAAAFGPGSAAIERFVLGAPQIQSAGSMPLAGVTAWDDARLIGATGDR